MIKPKCVVSEWASLVAQMVENLPAMQKTRDQSLEKGKATHTLVFWPGEFQGPYSPWGHKEADMTDFHFTSLIFPGGASGKEPACQCSRQETQVHSLGQEDPLEEAMATHSSILAWKIPWTEEPGGLQPMGLQRVRHDN